MKELISQATSSDPQTKELIKEISGAITDAGWWYEQAQRNYDTLRCLWPGQSEDGRKWREKINREPFPWEGASDQRIRTIDEIVNEQVMVCLAGFFRARVQAVAMDADDVVKGQRVTVLMKWLVWGQMRRRLRRELELLARWRQSFGLAISHVCMDSQYRLTEQPLTIEELAAIVAGASGGEVTEELLGQTLLALQEMFQDELRDPESIALVRSLSSVMTASDARAMVAAFRSGEPATLVVAEVFGAQPRWEALLPFVDVFFPINTDDIQKAPWIAHRELITDTELRERIETEGYDAKWTEQALTQRGQRWSTTTWADNLRDQVRNERGFLAVADKDLIEIWHVYRRVRGPKNTTAIYRTVLHHSIPEETAVHELMSYDHGMYPYVAHVREHCSRTLCESRGISEIAATWQEALKTQHDSRSDRTDLNTLPAMRGPARRGGVRPKLGPNAYIPEIRPGEFDWFKGPPWDQGSIEIEKSTERMVNRYFKRISEDVPPELSALYQQDLVDGWLIECGECCRMALQLAQQYLPDEIVARVAGPMARPMRMSREEIQGQYDLMIEFDSRNLNDEFVMKKLDAIARILPMDRAGLIDLAPVVEQAFAAVDPQMAQAAIRPQEAAMESEAKSEIDNWKSMVSGVEPPLPDGTGAMNYGLRLQVLQNVVQSNPEVQAMIQQRPILQQMIEARVKALQFQMQQGENAQIGRQGAGSVLGGAGMQPAAMAGGAA